MITFKQGEDNLLKHILIKSSDGNPLEISSISNHATYISVDHSTNKGAIRLTLRGLKPSYELNGQKITIHFTNGEFVEIPFISIH
jgi:hypothetical protein